MALSSPLQYPGDVSHVPLRVTVTQAFAATVVDESRTGPPPAAMQHDMSQLPDVGDIIGDHYRLVRLIGRGTFGRVYEAERVDVPEHRVALKLMPRAVYAGRDVERELVMLAAAGHPNVVQLKDHGMTDQYVWLTMPVYEGQTLEERLERRTVTLRECHEIFVPIARGVAALHSGGLRHQDLKPDNIYLAEFAGRLHPIILDLGVAAEKNSSFVAGTILFAAPEQIASLTSRDDRPPLSEKIDTYSLGATLLLSLVGPDCFPGNFAKTEDEIEDAQQLRAEHPLHVDALPSLTGAPREKLIAALRRWLALDPEQRASMGEMADELDVLLERDRELQAVEAARVARQGTMLMRFRLAVAGLLVGAVGLGGYGWTKRNTLRLANELARARAEGAAQFDKLETCAASHRLAEDRVAECGIQRARDRNTFTTTLERLSRTGNAAQAEYAEQLMAFTTRLRGCEEASATAAAAHTEEKDRLATECATRTSALTAKTEELERTVQTRSTELAELQSQTEQLRAEAQACKTRVPDNPYVDPPAPAPPKATTPPAASATVPAATAPASPASAAPPPQTSPAPPLPAPTGLAVSPASSAGG